MDLLIVPLMLALITVLFTVLQGIRQDRIEDQRADSALKIEEQRAQDVALQDYLDQMGSLLLNEDRLLRQSKEGDEVRTLARARTLTVLERMDPSRRGQVIQFLSEAGLIQRVEGKPIIRLSDANLGGTDMDSADLEGADMESADLRGANLRAANLTNADLFYAHLEGANLQSADLEGADLEGASGVSNEFLEMQASSLRSATMPDGSKHP
jgi:Pentapeptide repeats (8 copies)